jgi:LmeA-like phospholipid-binding
VGDRLARLVPRGNREAVTASRYATTEPVDQLGWTARSEGERSGTGGMTVTGGVGVADQAYSRRPQRSTRSKIIRRLVIPLVILLALLIAADFGAAAIFEYQVSKKAREQLDLTDDPSVTVHGFPFLTQALSGDYDHVTIDADGVPVQDTLQDLAIHADLTGVHAPKLFDLIGGGGGSITVDHVTGQVKVKAADLNRAVQATDVPGLGAVSNLNIEPVEGQTGGPGKTAGVKLCGTIAFAGTDTDVCVTGNIVLANGGKVTVAPKSVDVRNSVLNGPIAGSIQQQILKRFAVTLDPGVLPFKVHPTGVFVENGALAVQGEADDITLSK